jgi:hypothetical protein
LSEPFSPIQLIRLGRWHSALFGSYVLSLSFFEGVVLPALRQAGVRSIGILADLDGVAGALGEAGAREVGRTYDLRPVRVRSGVFHPKFMLLDGEDGPSAVIGSGNLTFGGWGHNLELCEVLRPERAGTALRGMADFLEELGLADRLTGADIDALGVWVGRLRGVPESGDARVVHNVSTPIADQLADAASDLGEVSRLTVASPYFGGAAAVDDLSAALGSPPVEVHVHDGERLALHGHHFPFSAASCRAAPVALGLLDADGSGPLHAKLIEIECELGSLLVTGSVNASVPALSECGNVELAVTRLVDAVLPRAASEVPPPMPQDPAEPTEPPSFGILHATLLGTCLRGTVLSPAQEGDWRAEFDHDGALHELGTIPLGLDGSFEAEVRIKDASYGRRRSTLILRRGDRQVRGFVSFPDAIELNMRWGVVIGPMIRVAGGSDDDGDLAGVLEYFASNPRETATAWRRPGAPAARSSGSAGMVSLSELAVRASDDWDGPDGMGGAARGAFDRILAALRIRWTGSSMRARGVADGHAELEDDDPSTSAADVRVIRAFDALLEVLADRVPQDAAVELQRAADIAGFVLLRTPEPRRITDFAAWWSNLAVRHLRTAELDRAMRSTAAGLLMLDGQATARAERARGRLARVLGDVPAAVEVARSIEPVSRISRLAEVVGGPDGMERFAAAVLEASSAVEEVIIAAGHVRAGTLPPPLTLLDGSEEMRAIRRHIGAGETARIVPASQDATACPRCHYGLPEVQRLRLASVGIARAANCCNRVLLVGID